MDVIGKAASAGEETKILLRRTGSPMPLVMLADKFMLANSAVPGWRFIVTKGSGRRNRR